MLCCFGHISCGRTSFVHRRSRFPATVSCRVTQCHAALPRVFRKQLSDLSNVLAEMEARDAQRREQSQATKSKARHGEELERAALYFVQGQEPFEMSAACGAKSSTSLWFWPSKTALNVVSALDSCCVRQWMQYVRQNAWPHSGRSGQNRLRRQKKKSRRHKKMTHAQIWRRSL